MDARERKRKVDAALARVGMSDSARTQLRKFSKGMLQRVGIAQAIVHDPKLVLLDEPMSGLDPIGRREVRDLVQQLNEEGKTIFFSTHILSDAETLCDRVAVLNKGELKGVGVVADLLREVSGEVEVVWQRSAGDSGALRPGRALPRNRRCGAGTAAGALAGSGAGCAAQEPGAADQRDSGAGNAGGLLPGAHWRRSRTKAERGEGMIGRLWAIAFNTYREAVRDRVLYNLILFALLIVGSSVLFGQISLEINRIVLINLGLTAISLFGIVIAIFIGIGLVSKEIEKRTLYTVLAARPVRRWEFITGKFLGLVMTLTVNALLMSVGFFAAVLYVSHGLGRGDLQLVTAIYFILLEFVMITALALLFSTFSTPVFSSIFAFAIFAIGTFAEDLRGFAADGERARRDG